MAAMNKFSFLQNSFPFLIPSPDIQTSFIQILTLVSADYDIFYFLRQNWALFYFLCQNWLLFYFLCQKWLLFYFLCQNWALFYFLCQNWALFLCQNWALFFMITAKSIHFEIVNNLASKLQCPGCPKKTVSIGTFQKRQKVPSPSSKLILY